MDMKANLEQDLLKVDYIVQKCKDHKYAQHLYAALCNNRFFKNDEEWTCSWRHAASLIAEIRNVGEDYLDWYCSGMDESKTYVTEGTVTSEISHDLLNLGWHIKSYEPRLEPGIYSNKW